MKFKVVEDNRKREKKKLQEVMNTHTRWQSFVLGKLLDRRATDSSSE
jgi:hypothetical protein